MGKSSLNSKKLPKNNKNKRNKLSYDLIISKSKKLFYEKGFNLSLHDIAKELNTRPSSIYRHFISKRDLWFALTSEDFKEFENGIQKITQNHTGPARELMKKIGIFFINFASWDFNRFRLMFLYEPPKANLVGPYEQECNPDSISTLIQLCDYIIKEEELHSISPPELAVHMLSIVLGYAILISPINDYLVKENIIKDIGTDSFKNKLLTSNLNSLIRYFK